MSLITVLYIPDGIVIASDSRLALQHQVSGEEINIKRLSDSTKKIFLVKKNIALAVFGDLVLNNLPIQVFISKFIEDEILFDTRIEEIPVKLIQYFESRFPKTTIYFYLAGYSEDKNQQVFIIETKTALVQQLNMRENKAVYDIHWGGETEILQRLLKPVKLQTATDWELAQTQLIPYQFFSLEEGVQFSEFALRTVIEYNKYKKNESAVGGGIVILTLSPDGTTEWLKK